MNVSVAGTLLWLAICLREVPFSPAWRPPTAPGAGAWNTLFTICCGRHNIWIFAILQVVHLCVQSRPGDGGEHSLAALWAFWGRPERQGEKPVLIVLNWPYLGDLIRWSETCRRTSARVLASSPWPTTRRLLSPFRFQDTIFLSLTYLFFLQFY